MKRPNGGGGGSDGPALTKRQRKAKNKAAEEEKKTQAAAAAARGGVPGIPGQGKKKLEALMNGGVGDGARKGKGKGKASNGKAICFAYNNGTACKGTPCPLLHICQVCEGNHPKSDPSCPGKPA